MPPDLEAIRARAKSAIRDRAALTAPPRDAGRIPELVADIDVLLAEVERLRHLERAITELEGLHGNGGTCSAAGPCAIGEALKIVRSHEAANRLL